MANDKQAQYKECSCKCTRCNASDQDMHLHVEIENLKQKLVERDSHIAIMETNVLNEANKFPNGEMVALQEELFTWQDKYKRLYEAHRRIQRVNQGLEDKLLRLVDICETEKTTLTKDVATLSHKLAEANYSIKKLTQDNERYKNDVALAIQFLQCKQGNFVSQKLNSLPNEVQAKISSYVTGKKKPEEKKPLLEAKSIKVPIPTFPPTAMVYSIPKSSVTEKLIEKDELENTSVDIVSAAIMAKVLEERERERSLTKHCDTCTCSKNLKIIHDILNHSVSTQTGDSKNSLCLKCNTDLDSVGTIKIVKDAGTNNSKSVPICTHDYDSNFLQVNNDGCIVRSNVAKVEPNNYLKESDSICSHESHDKQNNFTSSHNSNTTECEEDLVDQETTPLLGSNHKTTAKFGRNVQHHHLCDKASQGFHSENTNQSAKKSESVKGPRYCSLRVQSGSKNILLDNIHNNVAPLLYTHPNSKKSKKDDHNLKLHRVSKPKLSSNHSQIQSNSNEDLKSIDLVDDSLQNQQRVVEWIQSNQNNMLDGSVSSDNSRSDSLKKDEFEKPIDPIRYAEMENNVKKFLFGESEFLKKVAIGKQNYQNLRCVSEEKNHNSSNSHTETEI